MAEYEFVNKKGEIVAETYNRTQYLSSDSILSTLQNAFRLFPYDVNISIVDSMNDVFCVAYVDKSISKNIYICGKGLTPGGRKALQDEQRIQPKAKFLNYVYNKHLEGNIGIFLGVYLTEGTTVFCTWKLTPSTAGDETPISKQIKISAIAKAIKEGFAQYDKGRGEYACAFKPEFLYFYIRNCDWLHTGNASELTNHINSDENTGIEPIFTDFDESYYHTEIESNYSRSRILFGAPGTGKSHTLNKEALDLLRGFENNYERVTFHPDYSYANFVGTYKPVMVERQANIIDDSDTKQVISVLNDGSRTAQEKYDILYERFKGDGITRLPILLGLYTDESFKTRKQDGSDAAGDNSVEKNHGRAIRKYVSLITGKEKSGDIAYEYVPGPFMRIYVNALRSAMSEDPKPYLLIIEEINRANVAAVFGDIFQLLDRDDDGVSEYPIQTSEDVKKYLANELGGNPSNYNKIRIPNNMFIWATMNSADQGVFPMDTAFKRRWDFTYIGINEAESGIRGKNVLLGKGNNQRYVEWNALRKAINDTLSSLKINEDKLLGPYFLSRKIVPENSNIEADVFISAFKNKVLMYLFDDAAKQKRTSIFANGVDTTKYSAVCEAFDEKGVFVFCKEISDQFMNAMPETSEDKSV